MIFNMGVPFFRRKVLLFFVSIIWSALVVFAFNRFAYEIDGFNASVRIFLKHGTTEVRSFDADGLPYSRSAKYSNGFVSPFYVVHYGLIYSESVKGNEDFDGAHWGFDETTEMWNVPPSNIKEEFFISSADWVVENISLLSGKYHLVYNFDWTYQGYPNGGLKAPWYSGLTDAYAIILMLRAYDVTGHNEYLNVAERLYQSTVAPFEQGGSLTELDGSPWIEEYVDPSVFRSADMAFVLNGMVYATYGIIAYERFSMISDGYSEESIKSIVHNLKKFDKNGWSYYDLIGNPANIKYHRIHVALLEEMIGLVDSDSGKIAVLTEMHQKWKSSSNNLGYFWLLNANKSIAYYHFIAALVISASLFPLLTLLICKVFFRGDYEVF